MEPENDRFQNVLFQGSIFWFFVGFLRCIFSSSISVFFFYVTGSELPRSRFLLFYLDELIAS